MKILANYKWYLMNFGAKMHCRQILQITVMFDTNGYWNLSVFQYQSNKDKYASKLMCKHHTFTGKDFVLGSVSKIYTMLLQNECVGYGDNLV